MSTFLQESALGSQASSDLLGLNAGPIPAPGGPIGNTTATLVDILGDFGGESSTDSLEQVSNNNNFGSMVTESNLPIEDNFSK